MSNRITLPFDVDKQSIDSAIRTAEMKGRLEGKVEERQNMLELINKGYSLDEIKAILEKGEMI